MARTESLSSVNVLTHYIFRVFILSFLLINCPPFCLVFPPSHPSFLLLVQSVICLTSNVVVQIILHTVFGNLRSLVLLNRSSNITSDVATNSSEKGSAYCVPD